MLSASTCLPSRPRRCATRVGTRAVHAGRVPGAGRAGRSRVLGRGLCSQRWHGEAGISVLQHLSQGATGAQRADLPCVARAPGPAGPRRIDRHGREEISMSQSAVAVESAPGRDGWGRAQGKDEKRGSEDWTNQGAK